jgi:hypothetical protein
MNDYRSPNDIVQESRMNRRVSFTLRKANNRGTQNESNNRRENYRNRNNDSSRRRRWNNRDGGREGNNQGQKVNRGLKRNRRVKNL